MFYAKILNYRVQKQWFPSGITVVSSLHKPHALHHISWYIFYTVLQCISTVFQLKATAPVLHQ